MVGRMHRGRWRARIRSWLGRPESVQRPSLAVLEPLEERAMLATFLPGEILVQFDSVASVGQRAMVRGEISGGLVEQIQTKAMRNAGQGVLERISIGGVMSVDSAIERIRSLPGVLYAEPNWIYSSQEVSDDTHYVNGILWGMYGDDQPEAIGPAGTTNQYGTQAEDAWSNGFVGSSDVYIGVIDEGIQLTHPDLVDNIWTNPFDPVDGIDNDGNGRIDDTNGWDFYSNDNSVYDGTLDDHGTHVAGTIGATGGNGLGVAGINWDVTMISVKFLGAGGGSTSGAIQALDYLTDLKTRHGLNIVATSNSWGGGGFSQGLLDAITRAADQGMLFIAAAGNSGTDNDTNAFYPASYDTTLDAGFDAVISVASITSGGARSSFSSYGATAVDLGAPGSSIASTVPTDGYAYYSGTSMATPHVAGAVALYAAANPNSTALERRNAILNSTTPTSSLDGITATGGRLNVSELLSTPVTPPSLSIADVSVTEGDGGSVAAEFILTLSAASSETVTVDFATSDDSANAGTDYVALNGTVTFAPGETQQSILIQVGGDTEVEPDETFIVTLSNALNATIATPSADGTILNDDVLVVPAISINDVQLLEKNTGVQGYTFIVTLSAPSSSTVSVDYATVDGTATVADVDYYAKSGTLSFSPGQTSKVITVQTKGDRRIEPDEEFFVVLSSSTGGATISDDTGVGVILNDDGANINILVSDVLVSEGDSGFADAVFRVTLTAPSTNTVTVSYSTSDGTASAGDDYVAQNGVLEFTPGQTEKLVTIQVIGDTDPQPDQTFTVQLSDATNAVIADSKGLGTILNDDTAPVLGLSINDVQIIENQTGVLASTFIVSLSFPSSTTVTVAYTTVDGTATVADVDYYAKSGTVTFLPGQTSKVVSIQTKGDRRVELDEEFYVVLSSPTGGATIVDEIGIGTILNDDGQSATSVFTPRTTEGDEITIAAFADARPRVLVRAPTKSLDALPDTATAPDALIRSPSETALPTIAKRSAVDDFAWAVDIGEKP